MSTTMKSVTIAPPFSRVFRILLTTALGLFVLIMLVDLVRGETPLENAIKHWSSEETVWLVIAVGFLTIIAAGITAIGRYAALVVNAHSISGRTESGQRIVIPTDSVSGVEYRPNPMVPGLFVSCSQPDVRLFAVLWGVDVAGTCEDLSSTIGPTHKLTRWFQEHAP